MGAQILNTSYQFTCSASVTYPAPFIKAMDPAQTKGKEQMGGTILTNQAKCVLNGMSLCKNNPHPTTGVPLPCVLSGHGHWSNTNTTMKINEKPTLTPKSTCNCASFGGTISTKIPSPTSKVGKNTSAVGNLVLASGAAAALVAGFVKPTVKATSQTTASVKTVGALGVIATSQGGQRSSEIGKEEIAATALVETTSSPPEDRGYLICNYETCGKWQDCAYYNATLEINNQSNALSEHYHFEEEESWTAYQEKERKGLELLAPEKFSHQAHHLIPGNQCLGRKNGEDYVYGVLIRLGVFFGYNINHSENCILLASLKKKAEGETFEDAGAYDVMSVMGSQWHSGGHVYTVDGATKKHMEHYFKENPSLGNRKDTTTLVSHYAQLVWSKLEALERKRYSINGRKKCQLKNYQQKKETFIYEMNKISQEIKVYLDSFSEDPKNSYPYFVSKRAIAYAYDIPSTVKIIVLTSKNGVSMAHKVRFERDVNKKGENGEFTFRGIKEGETHKLEQSVSFVRFCGNVRYFVDTDNLKPFLSFFHKEKDLCWKLPDKMEENESLTSFLTRQKEPIMEEIEKNEKSYEAPAGVARDRLEIMREII